MLGPIPGLPKVHLHNKVLVPDARRRGVPRVFRQAATASSPRPFVLVIEGSIPNEQINGDGYWTSFGNDPRPASR